MLTQTLIVFAFFFPQLQFASPAPTVGITSLSVAAQTTVTASAAVERVQKFYAATNRFTAKFRQIYTNSTFGTKSKSDGKVFIKKKGKMRWDYYKKNRKTGKLLEKSFLSDGQTMWAVEHDNKQFFKKSLQNNLLPVAITFLYGEGDLRKDFNSSIDTSGTYGSSSELVLKLTPKKPTQYKALWLVVNRDNYRVTQSIVLETSSGNTNHFSFYEPNFTKVVKDKWFRLKESELLKRKYRLIEGKKKKK